MKRRDRRVDMCARRVKEEEPEEDLWGAKEEEEERPRLQRLCKSEPRVALGCAGLLTSLRSTFVFGENAKKREEANPF